MLSFKGGGMGFRRTILLTRLCFSMTSTLNGQRKRGWRTGRTGSPSRPSTREGACSFGRRASWSPLTTLLNRQNPIFSCQIWGISRLKTSKLSLSTFHTFSFHGLPFLLTGLLWSRPPANPKEVQNCHLSRAWTTPSQAGRAQWNRWLTKQLLTSMKKRWGFMTFGEVAWICIKLQSQPFSTALKIQNTH